MSLVEPYLESPQEKVHVIFFLTVLSITVLLNYSLIISYFYKYLITEQSFEITMVTFKHQTYIRHFSFSNRFF